MQSIEIEAKTVEQAITTACEKFQTTENKLHIEILEDTPAKIMSFFSGKKAKIRASLNGDGLKNDNESVDSLKEFLKTIIKTIDPDASVEVKREDEEVFINIVGDGSGIFIGKKGQTLEALQYLINKVRNKNFRNAPHVTVDSESYRSRHIQALVTLAKRLSEKAQRKKSPVTTDPLTPADRRVIHMTLKKESGLTTWSKGEGSLKRVVIAPKNS